MPPTRVAPAHIVIVGFGQALLAHLEDRLAERSVTVLEDPDVIRKRSVHDEVRALRCVARVVPVRYHEPAPAQAIDSCLDGQPVDVVLPALEYGVRAAAALAAQRGLPGASIPAAECVTDKLRLREAAAAAGLRNPRWREVFGPRDVERFAAGASVVLKPANHHASLGVQLLAPGDDVVAAWAATTAARDDLVLPDRELSCRYLVEERIDGHEYSVEALVRGGEIVFLNVTDKLVAGGRHPVELGHVVPAELPAALHRAFAVAMAQLTAAIGFDTGVLHAEWICDGDGPILIECAGRLPGDSIVHLIDAAYDYDLVSALITTLGGGRPQRRAMAPAASAIRFLTATPGRVHRVRGVEQAHRSAGVTHAEVSVGIGDTVADLTSSWDRVGEVIAGGSTSHEARARAEAATALITIDTATPVIADAGR